MNSLPFNTFVDSFFYPLSNALHTQFNDLENEIWIIRLPKNGKKAIFTSSRLFAKIRYVHSTEQMFSNLLNDRP